jgi:hypothetical protein
MQGNVARSEEACMAGQPESQCEEALLQEVQPTILGIVRRKLRASLNPDDGQKQNQDALQLVGDIQKALLEKLRQIQAGEAPDEIADLRKYTAVVCYHACAEYYQREYPGWTARKNSLRYFLTHVPEYAVWEDDTGDLVGGFGHWGHERLAPVAEAQVRLLCTTPQLLQMDALLTKPIGHLRREDWQRLLTALFKELGAPLTLDDLVALVTALFGLSDENVTPPPPLSPPGPESQTEMRETLRWLWRAIVQLQPRQRIAYLLNPSGGELDVFPWHGIASISDIGKSLALTAEQYERLWASLPLDESIHHQVQVLRTPEEKFALLWKFLPLEDTLIAQVLHANRQQVINLRRVARDRLQQQLHAFR